MPKVDNNRLMGNAGSDRVTALLSSKCIVRAVARDDLGVDLYCETLGGHTSDEPFLHFWLQVKAGAQCRVASDGKSASFDFPVDHLRYWARQPVPVFAALVPDAISGKESPPVYVVDMTDFVLEEGIPDDQTTKRIRSKFIWCTAADDTVDRFLSQRVPECTALLQCRQGLVAPMPSLVDPYVGQWPTAPVHRYQEQIASQVLRTSAMSIMFLRELGRIGAETAAFRRMLARVVAQFDHDRHWETWAARATSFHADGRFRKAVRMYEHAILMIEEDEWFRDTPAAPLYIEGLRADCACALRRKTLPPMWPTSV